MTKAQQDFCEEFKTEHGDPVLAMTLARFCGTDGDARNAGLELPPGLRELWGLLITGEDSLHFYVHATGNPILSLFRGSQQGAIRPRQHSRIPYYSISDIIMPPEKRDPFSRIFATDTELSVVFERNGEETLMPLLLSNSPDTERVLTELHERTFPNYDD